jgi:NAD(P)-dependent dehydrogenase (short-subunit alcohol dehydrogenase family)
MAQHEGRVALVTGGGGGIGRAAAQLFAARGARVVVVDLKVDGGRETVEQIEASGGEALFIEADVTDESAVQRMLELVVSRFGRLDCAMNNAGISDPPRAFHEMERSVWERMLTINLTAVFLCMKHEIRQMLGQEPDADGRRGAIVNTASGAAYIPAPGQPHYTAAKHGVVGLTRSAAVEYYAQGIRTNAICPGVTDTPMVEGFMGASGPEIQAAIRATLPGGVMGRPADVGALAVWLCSDEARWVNGQGIVVDGGGVFH